MKNNELLILGLAAIGALLFLHSQKPAAASQDTTHAVVTNGNQNSNNPGNDVSSYINAGADALDKIGDVFGGF